MLLGAGRGFLIRHFAHGAGLVIMVAVIAVIILARLWPQFIAWIENRQR